MIITNSMALSIQADFNKAVAISNRGPGSHPLTPVAYLAALSIPIPRTSPWSFHIQSPLSAQTGVKPISLSCRQYSTAQSANQYFQPQDIQDAQLLTEVLKKKKHHRSYAMCDKSLWTQKSKEPGENTGGEEVRERWNDGNYANHCNEPLRHFPHKF